MDEESDWLNFAPIASTAPTAAGTANSLDAASGGLEKLLGLAIGGYTAIETAKNQTTAQKLAVANATAPKPGAATSTGLSLSNPIVLVAGLIALAFAAFLAFRK